MIPNLFGGWLGTNSALPTAQPIGGATLFMANFQRGAVLVGCLLGPQFMEQCLKVSTIENRALEKNHPGRRKDINL